jgi:hypothetical protein
MSQNTSSSYCCWVMSAGGGGDFVCASAGPNSSERQRNATPDRQGRIL